MSEGQALRDWWEELLQVHEFAHYREYAEELTNREVDFLQQALGLRGVETILDLACGGGRHSLELARRGFTVVGIDQAISVIRAARARAAEANLSVEFVHGDMRDLNQPGRFDTILVMNSSIGFFDDATNAEVVQRCAAALAPGGQLLVQCINPYRIESYMREFRHGWYPIGTGYALRDAAFSPREAALSINYRYVDPTQNLDLSHPGDRIRLYGFPELRALLEASGLRLRAVFGDAILPPVPFEETSQWQVLVAERPREAAPAELLSQEDA